MEQYLANILLSKLKVQQHSCINCNELFIPDARNSHHQKYCSKPECRKASKRASQQRYLSSEKGKDYFRGAYNVNRVRQWRKAHPGYWKRKKAVPAEGAVALQDFSNVEVIENKPVSEISQNHALQDFCFLQPALIVGLIANLTGSVLQDDIATTSRRLVDFGRDILGKAMPVPATS
jgi:hypothetical protein